MSEYEPVIGLEVHAQLLTKSKMFCGCANDYAPAEPNTRVCPVCLGMPGVLPVINAKAVEYTVMTGLALNCQVPEFTKWDRKNYSYPDLPKGYQISQYDLPLARDGWLEIETESGPRRVGIRRVHLEEDTAKLFHVDGHSLIDFNRAGVPLMEIVSEPDMRSVEEVRLYALKLRQILRYLGVNSGDMEKGAIRFEANISLRPKGAKEYGTRTEIKNLNSFRALLRSLEAEIERQRQILESGGVVVQETMGWDEERGVTVPQRGKEYAHDYRYFPEPDLPPLALSREWVEKLRARLPELPDARRDRFVSQYGLSRYDAGVLTAERAVADYYEGCIAAADGTIEPKTIANWVSGELFRLLKAQDQEIEQVQVKPAQLISLLNLVQQGRISGSVGKKVLEEAFTTGADPQVIVAQKGLSQISDEVRLAEMVDQVIAENPQAVQDYLGGKKEALGFLVGQVMRITRGQANPQLVNRLLRAWLDAMAKAGQRGS